MAQPSGARIIACALRDLGVTVLFGIVGIPVVEIAEEAINLGIRFIGFRNEQAASYAAGVYGYLTGRPGVCLVVGGPGVLHAMPGVCLSYPLVNSEGRYISSTSFAARSNSHEQTRLTEYPDRLEILTPMPSLSSCLRAPRKPI